MSKFSEHLLSNLNEMEFLVKSLTISEIHYSTTNPNLAKIIHQTKLCLINATLDLAFDIEYKINQRNNDNKLIKLVVENLNVASKNLHIFQLNIKLPNSMKWKWKF